MRWPWQRRLDLDDLPNDGGDSAAAEAALRDAQQHRAEVESRWPTIRWLTDALESHRRENGFAEMFNDAMRRKRPND